MTVQSSHHQMGFTLIELMVVIVIISIVASLVVMNLSGTDQRKAMQAREILMLDLQRINREANDQSRIYALSTQPATDVQPFQYTLLEYRNVNTLHQRTLNNGPQNGVNRARDQSTQDETWAQVKDQPMKELPYGVSFLIQAEEHEFKNANNSDLIGAEAPKLIWLGNGEVKPVRIQMYFEQKPVGDLIQVDYLGKVNATS